jgi:RNA polymerase sigma factor (sigma-70 family)
MIKENYKMTSDQAADTSASLLLRIRDPRDDDAWSTFVAVYSPLVRRYCVRKGLQASDAADVMQNVMNRVTKSIKTFEYDPSRGRFRSWLGTLAAREIATQLNHYARKPDSLADVDETASIDPVWNDEFTDHVLAVAMDRIRGEFENTTWLTFEASWLRQESPTDVAARLGVAVHTVYVNKSRILKRLEAEIRLLADDMPNTAT